MANSSTPSFSRRRFLVGGALLAATTTTTTASRGQPPATVHSFPQPAPTPTQAQAHDDLMNLPGLQMHGTEQVAMLLYPGFTALDFVGPHYFLACMMGAKVHLVTTQADLAPVASDLGLAIAPTKTMAECPADLAVLLVPGGSQGTLAAARDPATRDFVRDRGQRAKWVASVCTGSVILGAAGLLRGKRATSHWIVREVLPQFGAELVAERLVTDGNLMTAAGVTAGIDLGLALVEQLRGRRYAEALMLQAEYEPAPPFPIVTPATGHPAIVQALYGMCAPLREVADLVPPTP